MFLQGAGELVQGGTGGHDIVNHDHMLAAQVQCAFKGAADVLLALLPGQAGLWRGVERFRIAFNRQRQIEPMRQGAGDFQRLIEATLGKALPGQRQRHHEVAGCRFRRCDLQQGLGKIACDGQAMVILERLHQPIERESIAKARSRRIEMRPLLETGAADCARWCRQRTDGAIWAGEAGQVVGAGRAEQGSTGGGAAQKAVLREQCSGGTRCAARQSPGELG